MKRFIQSLLLVAFFIGTTIPAWGQTSTQGKEFWVALIPSSAPGDNHDLKTNKFDAYIAISAPKKCDVTVQNPQTGWSKTVNIPSDNSWIELKTDIGSGGDIPIKQWYTEDGDFPANETALKHGLKVTATEDISVFCCIRWEFSMDASNILPINAIQKDYIVQSYDPKGNGGTKKNNCTILAAEDCTVTIQLACKTNKNTTGTITPQLKAGQVYHLVSAENESLSGTKISSTGKIAVFAGSTCANVPAPKSDRDLLYEQLFPLDYWGQNFVVVRTKEKDANRVLITAQEDNTQVIIYGQSDRSTDRNTAPHETIPNDTITLNAGKSYEFEMSSGLVADATGDEPKNRWDDARKNSLTGSTFIDSAVYIKTSCPCAVLTYDVGSSYIRKTAEGRETVNLPNDNDDFYGAPAMTWVSPIEQMIDDIVFGVMGTDKTTRHFINIVVQTQDIENTYIGAALVDNLAKFKPVDGNPAYSYARLTLPQTSSSGMYYHLHNKYGFIATVYGNGDDESYAYSAGSSAVKRAIAVDGYRFTNQMDVSDVKQLYCINTDLLFNPQIGTDIIDKVIWDFGDGTSATTEKEDDITIYHQYTTPGWYDVTALISAHKECPLSTYPAEEIHFSFYVTRADTLYVNPGHACLSLEEQATKTEEEIAELLSTMHNDTLNKDTRENCYDPVFIQPTVYGIDTEHEFEERTARDSVKIGDKWYYAQPGVQDIPDTIPNSWGCDSIMLYHMRITTSLDFALNEQSAETCEKEDVSVPYTYRKGEIGEAWMIDKAHPDKPYEVENLPTTLGTGDIVLPAAQLKAGKYNMELCLVDAVFGDTVVCPFTLLVLYPADIFKIKFGNVLAVYNSKYNGGYNFTGFQWFMNGDTIPGATQSVYHSDSLFTVGDEFYVELTDQNGMKLQSCPQTLTAASSVSEKKDVPAEKILQDRHLYIRKDDALYDIYGQRVK